MHSHFAVSIAVGKLHGQAVCHVSSDTPASVGNLNQAEISSFFFILFPDPQMVVLFSPAFCIYHSFLYSSVMGYYQMRMQFVRETTLGASNFDFPEFITFVLQSIQRAEYLGKVVVCLNNALSKTVVRRPSPMTEQTTSKLPLTNIPPVCPYGRASSESGPSTSS